MKKFKNTSSAQLWHTYTYPHTQTHHYAPLPTSRHTSRHTHTRSNTPTHTHLNMRMHTQLGAREKLFLKSPKVASTFWISFLRRRDRARAIEVLKIGHLIHLCWEKGRGWMGEGGVRWKEEHSCHQLGLAPEVNFLKALQAEAPTEAGSWSIRARSLYYASSVQSPKL